MTAACCAFLAAVGNPEVLYSNFLHERCGCFCFHSSGCAADQCLTMSQVIRNSAIAPFNPHGR